MKKQTRSILEELESMHHARDTKYVIETRAENIIASAVNLIELMEETYTSEQVDDLTRKLLNSIKQKDSLKFKRSLGRVNESK
jgi:hypothetical protein